MHPIPETSSITSPSKVSPSKLAVPRTHALSKSKGQDNDRSQASKSKSKISESRCLGVASWSTPKLGLDHLHTVDDANPLSHLSDNEKAKLTEVFTMFDESGDGHISKDEIATWVQNVVRVEDEVTDLIAEMDAYDINKDKQLDLNEFLLMVASSKIHQPGRQGSLVDVLLKHTNSMKAHLGCDAFGRVAGFLAASLRDSQTNDRLGRSVPVGPKSSVDDWIQVLTGQATSMPQNMAKSLREDYSSPVFNKPQVTRVTCPFGHSLELFLTTSNGWTCNKCHKSFRKNYPLSGCRICNWDMCHDCSIPEDASDSEEEEHVEEPTVEPKLTQRRTISDNPFSKTHMSFISSKREDSYSVLQARKSLMPNSPPRNASARSTISGSAISSPGRSSISSETPKSTSRSNSARVTISTPEQSPLGPWSRYTQGAQEAVKNRDSEKDKDSESSSSLSQDLQSPQEGLSKAEARKLLRMQMGQSGRGSKSEEAKLASQRKHEEDAAAVKLQKLHRGNAARKTAATKRERKRENDAAIKVQKLHRGNCVRKSIAAEKGARMDVLQDMQNTSSVILGNFSGDVSAKGDFARRVSVGSESQAQDTPEKLMNILYRLKAEERALRQQICKLVVRNVDNLELQQLEQQNLVRSGLFADFVDALARNVKESD